MLGCINLMFTQIPLICLVNIAGKNRTSFECMQKIVTPVSSEFLIHAADVEGLCKGIDEQLVERK